MKQHSHENAGDGEKRDSPLKGERTVGEILLAARERAGLTLEDVSERTRIHRKMLSCLETDNFEAIPAKVYVKGFLRTYAELLALDVKHLLSKYEVQTGQTHTSRGDHWEIEADVVEEKLQPPRILNRLVIPAAVVCVVAVLIVWSVRRERPVSRPPSESSVLEDARGREGARDGERTSGAAAVDSQHPAMSPVDRDSAVDGGQSALPVPVPRKEPIPIILRLELIAHPDESTWFDLLTVSSRGARAETTAHDFILFPGESRIFEAADAFVLRRVGNAGGFTMKLNGTELPALGGRSEVKRNVVITKDDLAGRE